MAESRHQINTQYPISIEIDGAEFRVVVHEPNKEAKEKLEEFIKPKTELIEKISGLRQKLQRKRQDYELNSEIIKETSVGEKLKLWLEQKTLTREIRDLVDEIDAETNKLENGYGEAEKVLEKRYELLVDGDDANNLQKTIKEKNISYEKIFEIFAYLIKESKEKK